jgi:hypothetical protein
LVAEQFAGAKCGKKAPRFFGLKLYKCLRDGLPDTRPRFRWVVLYFISAVDPHGVLVVLVRWSSSVHSTFSEMSVFWARRLTSIFGHSRSPIRQESTMRTMFNKLSPGDGRAAGLVTCHTRARLQLSLFVALVAFCNLVADQVAARREPIKSTINASDPLVYKRLRLEEDSLQTLNRFQKYYAIDEHLVRFSVNETRLADEDHPSNRTVLVEYSYYQNDNIEASHLNYDDLVFEAIDGAYLTKVIPYFVHSYDDKRDLARASDKRLVSRSLCNKELDYMMEQLHKLERARIGPSPRAGPQLSRSFNAEILTLFDSFGVEQPGLLLGNHYWPGNWRQCGKSRIFHRDRLNPERTVDFRARYCVASLRSKRWDKLVAERIAELDPKRHFLYDSQRQNYARYHRIQIGVCLPESCDSRTKSFRYDDIHRLAVHKLSEPLRSYDLYDLYCLPDETSELRKLEPQAWALILFLSMWVGAVVLATVLDLRTRRRRHQQAAAKSGGGQRGRRQATTSSLDKLIDCMSFMKNLERLFETDSCQPKLVPVTIAIEHQHQHTAGEQQVLARTSVAAMCRPDSRAPAGAGTGAGQEMQVDKIQCLNCLKVVATLSIVMGHCAMLFKHIDKYTLDYDCLNQWLLHFNFSSAFFVDWHFVMAGFLATYVPFRARRIERHTSWSWLGTIVHRYVRLAPLYILLFLCSRYLVMHLSDGPLWDYGTSNQTVRSVCRQESILYPLTLTSNLHPIYEECVMPSWYLSCDFQCFLVTPFLLTILYKSPLLGWLVALGTIGASVAARFHRYLTDPRAQLLSLMRPRYDLYQRNNWDMYITYLFPQYRVGSYLVGILAGHYVYMVLAGRWHSPLLAKSIQPAAVVTGQPLLAVPPLGSASNKGNNSSSNTAITRKTYGEQFYRYAARLMGACILLYSFFATWFLMYTIPNELEPYSNYITSVIYAGSHVSVSFGFALFAISIILGEFDSLKRFMSLPFWSVLARFNYIIFIGQIEVIQWLSGSSDSLVELNNIELIKFYTSVLVFVYIVSAVLTPMLEIPIGLLERQFIAPLFAPKSSAPANNHNYQQAGAGSETSPAGLASPVPPRRNNNAGATTRTDGHSTKQNNQPYEMGQIAAGESTRLVDGK